ncbi:MAG: uracil-DNA glycosylase family protein [Bdellovibrionota bacterium]
MDQLFKQKLLNLRAPPAAKSFSEALMGEGFSAPDSVKNARKIDNEPAKGFTEKRQVIESLERFAKEKVEETQMPVIKFDRGEIHVKPDPVWDDVKKATDIQELMSGLSLEKEILDILFRGKKPGAVRVMFVTENIRPWSEVKNDVKGSFLDEVLTGFPLKTAEFFERMILAMKLDPSEVMIYPVEKNEESDLSAEVIRISLSLNPEILITLGAKATQKILKSNDRLSQIHGQFFERKVENQGSLQIVPLFHPSIIETNISMKKTTWADMQIIMKHLKKIP